MNDDQREKEKAEAVAAEKIKKEKYRVDFTRLKISFIVSFHLILFPWIWALFELV